LKERGKLEKRKRRNRGIRGKVGESKKNDSWSQGQTLREKECRVPRRTPNSHPPSKEDLKMAHDLSIEKSELEKRTTKGAIHALIWRAIRKRFGKKKRRSIQNRKGKKILFVQTRRVTPSAHWVMSRFPSSGEVLKGTKTPLRMNQRGRPLWRQIAGRRARNRHAKE